MAGNKLVELSAEQLVDCDGTTLPEENKADCGVFGGASARLGASIV